MRYSWLFLLLVLASASGCGGFAARRMVQAPNTYPAWLAPEAPVTIEFSGKLLTAFTNKSVHVASPEAVLRYTIVEPGEYQFRWTNRVKEAHGELDLSFSATVADALERTNQWTQDPRGTVLLVHGYGVARFVMLPWALLLAEEGWRSVLVDLRGHGESGGEQIFFGTQEVRDLQAVLGELERDGDLTRPVSVIGHSYGAVLALGLSMADSRVEKVVAISPYAELSSAVLNVTRQYARWLPESFITAGLRALPSLLQVSPGDLNPLRWMEENAETALFIAGESDRISPPEEVERLYELAGPGSKFLVIPKAAHEPLPFYLHDLAEPITRWLSEARLAGPRAGRRDEIGQGTGDREGRLLSPGDLTEGRN